MKTIDSRCPFEIWDLVFSVSSAMDLASPTLAEHQYRTAFIADALARRADLDANQRALLFAAALLHDAGALSPEEKVRLHDFEDVDAGQHCRLGALLFEQVDWLRPAAPIIQLHHGGWPTERRILEEYVFCAAQILCVADHVERWIDRDRHILHQNEDILARVAGMGRDDIDPRVIEWMCETGDRESFWLDLTSPALRHRLAEMRPSGTEGRDCIDTMEFSALLRDVIDYRSRFTATHSAGVAAGAERLARLAGCPEDECRMLHIAGNLHDIGKLVVPTEIIEKTSRLTPEEVAVMHQHPYYTHVVLSAVTGAEALCRSAAYHHERLDGKGYPFRIPAEDLDIPCRIMAIADAFTAVTEDRPYRTGMPRPEVRQFFQQKVDSGHWDGTLVDLLMGSYEEMARSVECAQTDARRFYDQRVVPLLN